MVACIGSEPSIAGTCPQPWEFRLATLPGEQTRVCMRGGQHVTLSQHCFQSLVISELENLKAFRKLY